MSGAGKILMPRALTLELNKAHWPVTVLGPGRRIGLWVQGCSIHCRGCISQDTWPRDPTKAIAIPDLVDWCKRVSGGNLDGVTISGGEPFEQPRGLFALLARLDAIIPEPFVAAAPLEKLWRGSANQPLVPLSERGRRRYADYVDAPVDREGKRMQAAIEGGRVWMIGLPARGDIERVEALCRDRGLKLTEVSWRR